MCLELIRKWLILKRAISLPEVWFAVGRSSLGGSEHLQLLPRVNAV